MLPKILKSAIEERGLSIRDAGKILDVSHSTLLRALAGESVDLSTLKKIAEWLNIRPSALLDTVVGDEPPMEARIETLVAAYPEIADVLEKAVVAVESGQADPGVIKDIVAYAEYRIQSSS